VSGSSYIMLTIASDMREEVARVEYTCWKRYAARASLKKRGMKSHEAARDPMLAPCYASGRASPYQALTNFSFFKSTQKKSCYWSQQLLVGPD
jgi:hypothetical protein